MFESCRDRQFTNRLDFGPDFCPGFAAANLVTKLPHAAVLNRTAIVRGCAGRVVSFNSALLGRLYFGRRLMASAIPVANSASEIAHLL
jgi:hypothetical protein